MYIILKYMYTNIYIYIYIYIRSRWGQAIKDMKVATSQKDLRVIAENKHSDRVMCPSQSIIQNTPAAAGRGKRGAQRYDNILGQYWCVCPHFSR
jgi:hypothetical protein